MATAADRMPPTLPIESATGRKADDRVAGHANPGDDRRMLHGPPATVIRLEADRVRSLAHARIVLRGIALAALKDGFCISRVGDAAGNLGPDGWSTNGHVLQPTAVGEEDGDVFMIVGPSVVRHMEAGPARLFLPADGSVIALSWPRRLGEPMAGVEEAQPGTGGPAGTSDQTGEAPVGPTRGAPREAFQLASVLLMLSPLLILLAPVGLAALFHFLQGTTRAPEQVRQPPPRTQDIGLPAPSKPRATSFRDCADCPEMVVIPAGAASLASGRHVQILAPFALGMFEVSFAEWDICVAQGGCSQLPDDGGAGRGRQAAISVSWDDAQQYVAWLSRKTGKKYRLPSEAEWEYAAQAGTGREAMVTPGTGQANCLGCGSRWDTEQAVPFAVVGKFKANNFGLHDMLGNVREWTADCWIESQVGAPADGSARTSGECTRRPIRGGSWQHDTRFARSTLRSSLPAHIRLSDVGFRVARSHPEERRAGGKDQVLGLPPGRQHGAPGPGARVVLHALSDSWIQVRNSSGTTLFERVLKPGESYHVPNQLDLVLATGSAGGLGVTIDGRPGPSLGPVGYVRRGIPLDPRRLAVLPQP